MITLKTLLGQLQDACHCTVRNDYDTTRFISRIDILRRDTVLCGDTLYLCPDEVLADLLKKEDDASKTNTELPDAGSGNIELKTDAFSEPDQTPALLVDAAVWETYAKTSAGEYLPTTGDFLHTANEATALQDRFSVIPVENMPAPEDTFLLLNQRLTFELRLQQEINDLYHLLYSGHGLDDLILRAESFLHRPMSVLDASYSMIAVSPLMHQLPFGMEKSKEGNIFLSSQEVESLRRLQIEHQIYKNNQAFFIRTEDHPDTNWIFCGIRIQHVMTGYVALCLPDKAEASEHELRLITAFSDICAIEMQKHEFFVQKTGLQYETFLTELLEGRFNDVNIIEARLKLLNRRFGKFFCLAILYCPEPHNSDLFNKRQMASLRQVYPNAMSVVYKNNIILLINQDTPVQLSPELTDPLEQFAERNHLKVSLSQPFADILKIRIFYHQALHTLELSDLQAPDQTLFYSTDVLPEYLFSKCNYQELEVGIHYHIFQLQDYDKTYHTDFVETLRAYLDHDRNAAKTAEFLHIHRSTFFYRVKKIEELLEISISDSHLLFLYELSFKIWDYLCR
ncbi:CdaR family transcriptional regulator [uncultured Eubacterium sp.]|uniref:PucR family transcriptional regulator n=1 Tax=uncultured Eubacterium sp. TaxID=165185 RepID=UPI002591404B|nr:helix-turn-helix domain-containing protein [uncultured Eubacterium sp.]